MKKVFATSIVIFEALICLSCRCYAESKSPTTFDEVDMQEGCYILSTLIDTPQFERDQGKSFLEDKLIIEDQATYSNFQKTASKARNVACKEVLFPSIDFSQKTLLGNWVSGSCAASGFERSVFKDTEKKEIIYSVRIKERNIACSGPGLYSINLIAIPKVPKGYKVIFKPAPDDHSGYQIYSYENGKTVARDWHGNIVAPRKSPPPGGGVFGVEMH